MIHFHRRDFHAVYRVLNVAKGTFESPFRITLTWPRLPCNSSSCNSPSRRRVYGYPSRARGIINSGSGDVAIKAGTYPNAHATSPRKVAIGNLRFIGCRAIKLPFMYLLSVHYHRLSFHKRPSPPPRFYSSLNWDSCGVQTVRNKKHTCDNVKSRCRK